MHNLKDIKMVFFGGSAGSLSVLKKILSHLPPDWQIPILIVIHLNESSNGVPQLLQYYTQLKVKEAEDKELPLNGHVYIAPPGYHLVIETDKSFSLVLDEPLNFSRPSIDICLETAVRQYRETLLIIILSGANSDGTEAVAYANQLGSEVWVQNPESCDFSEMTSEIINRGRFNKIYEEDEIIEQLLATGLY